MTTYMWVLLHEYLKTLRRELIGSLNLYKKEEIARKQARTNVIRKASELLVEAAAASGAAALSIFRDSSR